MDIIFIIIEIAAFCILPHYLSKFNRAAGLDKLLSDVVICFVVGILIGNTKQWWMPSTSLEAPMFTVAELSSTISVLFAIPMLLFISDITQWLKYTGKLLLSFILCIGCVVGSALLVGYWYSDLEYAEKAAGMLTGTYIGGTPNMVAISHALQAPSDLFVIINASDIMCSGIYFLFLTSVAKRVYGWFLPAFKPMEKDVEDFDYRLSDHQFPPPKLDRAHISPLLIASGISILIIGLSVGLGMLIPNAEGKMNDVLVLLGLTSFSILFSFYRPIRDLKGVYEFAQYLLLIFGVAAGFMADFAQVADKGGVFLTFTAIFVVVLVVAHFLLALIFRIDADTFIVTSAASIYGPPFIGQICASINNREILAAGMAIATVGLAIGNYMGVLVANILTGLG